MRTIYAASGVPDAGRMDDPITGTHVYYVPPLPPPQRMLHRGPPFSRHSQKTSNSRAALLCRRPCHVTGAFHWSEESSVMINASHHGHWRLTRIAPPPWRLTISAFEPLAERRGADVANLQHGFGNGHAVCYLHRGAVQAHGLYEVDRRHHGRLIELAMKHGPAHTSATRQVVNGYRHIQPGRHIRD